MFVLSVCIMYVYTCLCSLSLSERLDQVGALFLYYSPWLPRLDCQAKEINEINFYKSAKYLQTELVQYILPVIISPSYARSRFPVSNVIFPSHSFDSATGSLHIANKK